MLPDGLKSEAIKVRGFSEGTRLVAVAYCWVVVALLYWVAVLPTGDAAAIRAGAPVDVRSFWYIVRSLPPPVGQKPRHSES